MENPAWEEVEQCIDEFFCMEKGEEIRDPHRMLFFADNALISRQSLKHVVERRSLNDGMGASLIKSFIRKAAYAVNSPDVVMENHNNKYPASRLFGRFDVEINKGIMVVVDGENGKTGRVITIFLKKTSQFVRLLPNNKNSP